MATLKSELILSLIDRVSKPAGALQSKIAALEQAARRNTAKMNAMRGQLFGAAAAGWALYRGLSGPINAAAEFEAAINRVQAASGATVAETESLSKQAREFGRSTAFTATESALAQEMLIKNGLRVADVLGGATESSLKLAAASGSELAPSADLVTDVMANFKKKAGDLAKVADRVTGVMLASKFGFNDYRLALAQAGGVAGGVGVTLDDFNAVIAATSSRFASGSDAGTSFKNFLQRLVPSSKKAASVMKKMGLEFFETDGSMKSMAEIAQELQEGFAGLSDEARNDALSTIFGTDAMRTAVGLMEAGADGVRKLDETIKKASADKQADARMKGYAGTLKKFRSVVEDLQISIGNGLLPALTRVIEDISPAVSKIARLAEAYPQVTSSIVALTSGLIGLRVASLLVRYAFLWMKGGAIAAALPVLRLSKWASTAAGNAISLQKSLAGLQGVKYTPLQKVGTAIKAIARAVPGAGIVAGPLASIAAAGAALSAPAWGAIALGVALVAGAGALIWKYWDRLSSLFSGVAQRLSEELAPALDWIRDKLSSFSDFVKNTVGRIAEFFGADAEAAVRALEAMFDFSRVREKISSFFTWLGSLFQRETLTEEDKAAFAQAGYEWADGMVNAVKEVVTGMVSWFGGLPGRIMSAIGSINIASLINWGEPPAWLKWVMQKVGLGGGSVAEGRFRRYRWKACGRWPGAGGRHLSCR
ncbi:phage tail tape measure protein [Nitratireductor sp. GISD-1A_MAKvit]|uniref:phage tail tape measure protein n=1 Tax=Nitratireductor sp. GISD-1A_MAKvit TaxID=3234198 RepID=UPI003467536D